MCLNVSYSKVNLRSGGFKVIAHPCGHCVECARKYQNDWMLRLDDESSQWKTAMFATLTYSNENVPYINIEGEGLDKYRYFFMKRISQLPYDKRSRYVNDLTGFYDYLFPDRIAESTSLMVPYADIRDIQKFIKRLRINFKRNEGRDLKLKYFVCSEYGPATLRPHYHMIIFTNEHEFIISKYIKQCYGLGNVHDLHRIMSFSDRGVMDAMRYVSKYTCKPAEFENPYVVSGLIPSPRRLSSKFIGDHKRQEIKQAAADYRVKYDENGYTDEFLDGYMHIADVMKNGYKYSTPKYWRDVLFPQIQVENISIKDGKEIKKKSTIRDINDHLSLAISDYVQRRIDEVCKSEFAEIRCQHPEMSDTEVIRAYTIRTMEQMQERYRKAIQSFNSYYSKSTERAESGDLPINDGRIIAEEERAVVNLFDKFFMYGDGETDDFVYVVHDFGCYDACLERFENECYEPIDIAKEDEKALIKTLVQNKIKNKKTI